MRQKGREEIRAKRFERRPNLRHRAGLKIEWLSIWRKRLMDKKSLKTARIGLSRPIDKAAIVANFQAERELVEALPFKAERELAADHPAKMEGARATEDGARQRVHSVFAR